MFLDIDLEIIKEFEDEIKEIDNLIKCVQNDSLDLEQCDRVCEYLEIIKKVFLKDIKKLKKGA